MKNGERRQDGWGALIAGVGSYFRVRTEGRDKWEEKQLTLVGSCTDLSVSCRHVCSDYIALLCSEEITLRFLRFNNTQVSKV